LRPWSEADAEAMLPLFSDAAVMRFWSTPPVVSLDLMRAQICRSVAASPDLHAAWLVALKPTGAAIGFVNYHHREIGNRRLEIGYLIGSGHWRQGFAAEAIRALIAHCFDALFTHRIEATVDPANVASIHLLERLGFRCEGGPMRARLWTSNGRSLDAMMYALLKPEWEANRR
jgi:ribosomal-protein-alanine N-acetyltransferase